MIQVGDEMFYVETAWTTVSVIPAKVVRVSSLFVTVECDQSGILATQAFHVDTLKHINPGQGILMTAEQLETDLEPLKEKSRHEAWGRLVNLE